MEPKMMSEAVKVSRHATLVAMRDLLARRLDDRLAARDLAALSLRLLDVVREIESLDEQVAREIAERADPALVAEPWDPKLI